MTAGDFVDKAPTAGIQIAVSSISLAEIVGTGLNVAYNYSPTQNNGLIASMTDNVVGQTVSYISRSPGVDR